MDKNRGGNQRNTPHGLYIGFLTKIPLPYQAISTHSSYVINLICFFELCRIKKCCLHRALLHPLMQRHLHLNSVRSLRQVRVNLRPPFIVVFLLVGMKFNSGDHTSYLNSWQQQILLEHSKLSFNYLMFNHQQSPKFAFDFMV